MHLQQSWKAHIHMEPFEDQHLQAFWSMTLNHIFVLAYQLVSVWQQSM